VRAGVVSDIHGSYDRLEQAVAAMGPIEMLIHAGDGYSEIVRWQRDHLGVEVRMVAGNCDVFAGCPEEACFHLDRWKVLLTHGHLYGAKANLNRLAAHGLELGAALVIYGHTHRAEKVDRYGITLFNPGALSQSRCFGRPSFGLIETEHGKLEIGFRYFT